MRKFLIVAALFALVGIVVVSCARSLPSTTATNDIAPMIAATGTAMAQAAATPPVPTGPVGRPVNEELYRQVTTWLGLAIVYVVLGLIALGLLARLLVPLLEAAGHAGAGIGSCLSSLGGLGIWTVVTITIGGYFAFSKLMGSISPLGLIDNLADKALIAYALTCGVPALLVALAFFVWVHAKAKKLGQQPQEDPPPQ